MILRKFFTPVVVMLLLTSATPINIFQDDRSEKLIGTWLWKTIIDAESGEDMGIEVLTMGLTSEIKTEFRGDKTYVESKLKSGSNKHSETTGEWKIEMDKLSLKSNDKWRPATIIKMTNDSLLLQMNKNMLLLMLKQE